MAFKGKTIKHNIGSADEMANAQSEGGGYTGKTPPKGVYKGVLKQFGYRMKDGDIQANKNGDNMLKGLVEFKNSGAKSKYDGYSVWFNQNISKQGAPYINKMFDAMDGGTGKLRKAFWHDGCKVDEKGLIVKIGKTVYKDGEVEVVISTKDGTDNNGNRILELASWMVSSAATDDDDDDDEDFDEEDELDEADDEDEDEDDEDESGDDADDDSDDDDDDDDVDDDDDDEDDEDEDEDEDEEDDEDDEDESDLLSELKQLDRAGLKKRAKELGLRVTTKDDENSLINKIMEASDEEPPF